MAKIEVPIQVNLPDDWIEQIVNRLRNDPDAEWAEIVRCKDCKYYIKSESYCDCLGLTISDLDFCSKAERRTDAED